MIQNSAATPLERASLQQSGADGYSEAWLQDLLYRYPQSLPIDEIDNAYTGLVSVCCELNTSAGPLDVLYVTQSGRIAVAEAKLWRNPEARRKVVAQILDYAKELTRWNYETLDAAVRQARRAEGRRHPGACSRSCAPRRRRPTSGASSTRCREIFATASFCS
jgi:hypothetical protein